MAAGEEKYGYQRDAGPEVAVLDDGEDVGVGDGSEGDGAEERGYCYDDFGVVDRAYDLGVRDLGELAGDKGMDCFGAFGAGEGE